MTLFVTAYREVLLDGAVADSWVLDRDPPCDGGFSCPWVSPLFEDQEDDWLRRFK